MLYQVMIRARAQSGCPHYACWEPFSDPTLDRVEALRLVMQAHLRRSEALVVQAQDAADLAELVRQLRSDEAPMAPVHGGEPDRDAPVEQPRVAWDEQPALVDELLASWDEQRWRMEQGAGGDHDTPYRFTLPTSNVELRAWARLLARFQARALRAVATASL